MKKLQLILTNPCSENWDDMQPTDGLRYCDTCEKHIQDLTTKSDAELIQFFKKKKDNVCGRLLSSQLNRELVQPPSKASWHWLLQLTMGTMVITPAQAKDLKPVMVKSDQMFSLPPVSDNIDVRPRVAMGTISGKVLDERTAEPLKGVKVRQKGFENVLALTDSAGVFELSVEENSLAIAFTFELGGYDRVESKLNDGIVIKLANVQTIRLGGISTISSKQEPLYLIYAGKKNCSIDASRLKEIQPEWIGKLEILKDAKATALYGAKAANGVILIEIKKAYARKIDFSQKK